MSLSLFRKTHRWVGFSIALIVLLLCVTGIALNHSSGLKLGGRAMPGWAAQWFYQQSSPEQMNYKAGAVNYSVSSIGELTSNGASIISCSFLSGVIEHAAMHIAVCADKLVLLTPDAELIEEYYFSQSGLADLQQLFVLSGDPGNLYLQDISGALHRLNLDSLQLSPIADTELVPDARSGIAKTQSEAVSLSRTSATSSAEFSLERLLLDLHSGRAVGGWGVWLVDLCALGLVWLIVSGYLSWRARQKQLSE